MLILSRKVGEKIVIGDGITVVVSRVAGDRVTLGFEAPPEVRILRGELRPFDQPKRDRMADPMKPASDSQSSNFQRRDRAFEPAHVRLPR
jgi:carbon storage regulator